MDVEILRKIGLTAAQIKVYLALLELGATKSGPILKNADLAGSVVYRALEELIGKGLVSFAIKAKTKYFAPTEPKNLLRLWEDNKNKLEAIVPKLEARQKAVTERQETRTYVGWKGLQTAYNSIFDILPEGSDYLAFASITHREPESVKIFFQNFHRKRIAMDYKVKLIVNNDIKKDFLKKYNLVPKIEVRYINNFAPEGITIFGDNVLITTFGEEKPIAIIISSKQIANSFKKIFYRMWETAEK